ISSPGKLKTATSSVAATCRKMSVVRARMSRNVHHTLAIHNATRYAAIIVIPIRRTRSSWVTKSWRSISAPEGSILWQVAHLKADRIGLKHGACQALGSSAAAGQVRQAVGSTQTDTHGHSS